MRCIRILAVGRLKIPHWQEASAFYRNRLSRGLRLEEDIVKDAGAELSIAERKAAESERLLKKIRPGDAPVCLDESGRLLDSNAFADMLRRFHDSAKTPCFLIGGAYGHAPALLDAVPVRLSLSPMTFPHELARVLLLEQIYRAENILAGTGYHH